MPDDVVGTSGRGGYGGYNRAFAGDRRGALDRRSSPITFATPTSGLRQREAAVVYAGAQTAANIQLNAGVTIGLYRPRGAYAGRLAEVLNDDRSYLAVGRLPEPYRASSATARSTSWGVAGVQSYDSLSPNLWLAPSSHLSVAYSFERATYDQVRASTCVSGTWQISGAQSLAARWVDYDGGYYRLSYRRSARPQRSTRSASTPRIPTSPPLRPEARLGVDAVRTIAAGCISRRPSCGDRSFSIKPRGDRFERPFEPAD